MVFVVTALYVLGFLLVVGSLAVGVPVTRTALSRMEEGARRLRGRENELKKQMREDAGYFELPANEQAAAERRIERDAAEVIDREAAAVGVYYARGVAIGGDDSKTIANAVRYVARVNRPTAALALSGGLASTVASILSLHA